VIGIVEIPGAFQFFPSCCSEKSFAPSRVSTGLSILSQLLHGADLSAYREALKSFNSFPVAAPTVEWHRSQTPIDHPDFQFFPSCCKRC
jgi:hypothetical protein